MSSYDIRLQARAVLKDLPSKYRLFLIPIVIGLLYVFAQFKEMSRVLDHYETSLSVYRGTSFFPELIGLILTLVSLSATYTMVEVVRQQRREVDYKDSLRVFSLGVFLRLLLLGLVRFLLLLPWFLLCFLPALAVIYIVSINPTNNLSGLPLVPLLCWIVGFTMLIIKSYAYSQTDLILLDRMAKEEDLDPFDIVKESKQLMVGKKLDLFVLQLSFLGWHLLTAVTGGLALIYVLPYTTTAAAVFYDNLKTSRED